MNLPTGTLGQAMFNNNAEKTYIDKILARKEVERARELVRKTNLNRSEILELLYMLSSSESKLYNFGEHERYIMTKFFIWIKEFTKIAELMFDDYALIKEKYDNGTWVRNERTLKFIRKNEIMIEHNTKFLVELYLNICRTSLSLGGSGFLELLKSKFEISYPEQSGMYGNRDDKSIFSWRSGSRK